MLPASNPLDRLPAPDPAAAAHSARLLDRIRAEIAEAGGAISFTRFMDLALYAPGLGYYRAGARKFGPGGDFVTAPELSPLFSRCLARQCQQILEALGGGMLLELGAGTGVMAADLLGELRVLDALPERYAILELSGELCERQRQTLEERVPELLDRVVWLDALPDPGLRGVVLGNEVLDALPAERFFRPLAQRGLRVRVVAAVHEDEDVHEDADVDEPRHREAFERQRERDDAEDAGPHLEPPVQLALG